MNATLGHPFRCTSTMSMRLSREIRGAALGSPTPSQAHLHHVHEIAKADALVYGQAALAVLHAVVDDVTAAADAQHVVPRVSCRLAQQEEPVFGGLQELHSLLARDLPVEPPAAERVALGLAGHTPHQGSPTTHAPHIPTRAAPTTHGMRLSLGSAERASRSRSAPAASRPSSPLSWCLARYQLLLCREGSQGAQGGPVGPPARPRPPNSPRRPPGW